MLSLIAALVPTLMPIQTPTKPDWLIDPAPYHVRILPQKATKDSELSMVLTNGLIRRVFHLSTLATIGVDNLMTGESMLRAIEPEATLVING